MASPVARSPTPPSYSSGADGRQLAVFWYFAPVLQIRRVRVVGTDQHLIGIISLADIARKRGGNSENHRNG